MREAKLARESLWGTVITYIGVTLGFVTTFFVLTNYLTPEEVGLTRLLFEVATLLSGFCLVGLSTSISRYFPYFRDNSNYDNKAVHHGFWRYVCLVALLGSCVSIPLFYLLREPIQTLFARNSALFIEYYYLVIPLALSIVLWTISELYSIQLLHLAAPRAIRELGLRVLLLVAYIVYALTHISQSTFLWIFVGCYAVCALLSVAYLRRVTSLSWVVSPGFVTPELRSNFYRYTLLALLSTVGTTLAGRMDLFMLALVDRQGLVSAAVFSIAFFMVSIMEIPTRAMISIATPYLSDAMKRQDYARTQTVYQRISFYQFVSASIIFVLLWCNMHNVFAIMPGGADYTGAKSVFFFLGIAKLVEVLFTGSHPIVHGSQSYHWNLYYTLILIVVSFIANLYLIPIWGPTGAAVATLTTCIVGYGLQQTLLYYKLSIHPLAPRLLIALPLVGLMLLVDYTLPKHTSPYLDLAIRSGILASLGIGGLLLSGTASELKHFMEQYLYKYQHHANTTNKY